MSRLSHRGRLPTSQAKSPAVSPTRSPRPAKSRSLFILFVCQTLSFVPALLGTAYCLHHALALDTLGQLVSRNSTLDYALAGLWAAASGVWCYRLASTLIKRWLVYYELGPAVVRLLGLQAFCWPLTHATVRLVVGPRHLIAAWAICAFSAATSQTIAIWVTSNIRLHTEHVSTSTAPQRRLVAPWAATSPFLRSSADRAGRRGVQLSGVLMKTVIPLALLSLVTGISLGVRSHVRSAIRVHALASPSRVASLDIERSAALGFHTSSATAPPLRVLILVTSSWTERSRVNRASFRNSSLLLVPRASTNVVFAHRFLVGRPPRLRDEDERGRAMAAERVEHGDILDLSVGDAYERLSQKTLAAYQWADGVAFDWAIKTDDDMFVRFDTLARELVELGPRSRYWRGLAYWNIPPIADPANKNADFAYELSTYPPFVAGALSILSRDLVAAIAAYGTPRRYLQNEDQSVGLWLFGFDVKPIHDIRIQQAHVCEDDQIAKHFSSQYIEPGGVGPEDMYRNIVEGRRMCHGFMQRWCGVCYPSCRGRENHWRDWGFACHPTKGLSLSSSMLARTADGRAADLGPVRVEPDTSAMGTAADPWIVEGLLSTHASPLSNTDDWHLLHVLCFTTDPSTFQERHWAAFETIWVHEPRAILFILSNTLPLDFFDAYKAHGYAIHVVPFSKELLLERRWFLGPGSEQWIRDWDRWSWGPNWFSHLTDYLRYFFLYTYGGTYLDTDAPWIRSPPDAHTEFIGADYSTLSSDLDWTLDDRNMYLAPGVMRFRAGWTLFRTLSERVFSSTAYTPSCFNCVGPRAITTEIKPQRARLEAHGLTILPSRILYPRNWQAAQQLVVPVDQPDRALAALTESSWSIHLFGKMTNHLAIASGSICAAAFDAYNLGVARPSGRVSSVDATLAPARRSAGLELRAPTRYRYRARAALLVDGPEDVQLLGSLDGRFDGLDVIYARGTAKHRVEHASVRVTSERGGMALTSASARRTSGVGSRTLSAELHNATLRDFNVLLGSIVYVRGAAAAADDELRIDVVFGTERASASIAIVH